MSQPPDDHLDLILIEKIRNGTEAEKIAAQEQLFKRRYPKFLKFFSRKGFTESECEDLTQESFLRVFQGINEFQGDSLWKWLFTIATNVWKNEIRRRRTIKRDARETSFEQVQEDDPAILANRQSFGGSSGESPLDQIVAREDRAKVHQAIEEMPPKMRSCCLMRYVHGMKYRDIAVALKISIGAVKAHLAQARERLKKQFGIDLAPKPGD